MWCALSTNLNFFKGVRHKKIKHIQFSTEKIKKVKIKKKSVNQSFPYILRAKKDIAKIYLRI